VYNGKFVVANGANTLNSLPLCEVKIPFQNYQRLNITIAKAQTDFVLAFNTLGIKPTFLAITVKYCGTTSSLNYLKWKFQNSSDVKRSLTSMMVLTATTSNPIEPILIDNPNPDCPVTLEVLVATTSNDYLGDTSAFIYLNELTFDKVHTFQETTSEIFAFFDSTGTLVGTVSVSDITNAYYVPASKRIVLDDASNNDIVLDFIDEYNALQALSAISWVMADPANLALPKPADLIAPIITYTGQVISGEANVDLQDYTATTYTKLDFITQCIAAVTDNMDGAITPSAADITFTSQTAVVNSIVESGTYTVSINISDIAGNTTTDEVVLIVTGVASDNIPPVINYTNIVTGVTIAPMSLASAGGVISKNDIKIAMILSVTDNADGNIPLSSVAVSIIDDGTLMTVTSITATGSYSITFTVQDAVGNIESETLGLVVNA
jgi:hypothetical protein